MEESWKWVTGIIISLLAIITTWTLASRKNHKDTHKDFYNKLDDLEKSKANKDFVREELKKLTENVNSKIEEHVRESVTTSQMMVELILTQKSLITSIDENVKIVLSNMINKPKINKPRNNDTAG